MPALPQPPSSPASAAPATTTGAPPLVSWDGVGAAGGGAPPSSGSEFASISGTLWRRRWPFLAIFVAFVGLVAVLTMMMPKTYTTSAKMIAGNPGASSGGPVDPNLPILNMLAIVSGAQSAETYAELLQETPVARDVAANLHLNVPPGVLLSALTVKPVTNTSILSISITWHDPKTAAKITNEFAKVFVQRQRDLVAGQASSAIAFISKQLPEAERRATAAQAELATYQESHHIADLNAQTQSTITTMSALDSKIAQIEVDRQQAQAQLASLTSQMAHMKPTETGSTTVAENPVLGQLKAQLAQVTVQLRSAEQQYTDEHPTVIALKEQQAQLKREIASQPATIVANTANIPNPIYQQLAQQATAARAQMASADAQLGVLRSQRAALDPVLRALPAQTSRLATLQRNAKLTNDVYTALEQKLNDATIAKTTALSDVTITEPATPEAAAVKPNLKLNLLVGIVLGLALATTGIFVLDFFDNSLKDEADVTRELALPVLATIPRLDTKGRYALPWIRSLTIESFLQLVTSLRYSSDTPIRTLTFTSPSQGDGKSTVALNTAIAMAEVSPRVLLVDADLRRPSLHAKLSLRNERGLSDILVGTAGVREVVRPTRHGGLDLVTAGTRTPNPFKLLQSDRFDQFLEEALQEYRTVIIDGPALAPVIDGVVLSAKCDGTVLVVAAGATDLRSTKRALTRLQTVGGLKNLLGVVINRSTPKRAEYSGYYLQGEHDGAHVALTDSSSA